MTVFSHTVEVEPDAPRSAADLLARLTGLSRAKIKEAMHKGAVRYREKGGGWRRLRKAKATIAAGGRLEIHYDSDLLARVAPAALCLGDRGRFSVWLKPAGLLAQGTLFGDHCSLERQAELHFRPARPVFLVHRLDREASGLMLLAHSKEAAARLSRLFRENRIEKRYLIEVRGNPGGSGKKRSTIDFALDGKPAVTEYRLLSFDRESDTARLEVRLKTGRLHQIRRHFALLGHPVLGDPRYGRDNKNPSGLRLAAVGLAFRCPFEGIDLKFTAPAPDWRDFTPRRPDTAACRR